MGDWDVGEEEQQDQVNISSLIADLYKISTFEYWKTTDSVASVCFHHCSSHLACVLLLFCPSLPLLCIYDIII